MDSEVAIERCQKFYENYYNKSLKSGSSEREAIDKSRENMRESRHQPVLRKQSTHSTHHSSQRVKETSNANELDYLDIPAFLRRQSD